MGLAGEASPFEGRGSGTDSSNTGLPLACDVTPPGDVDEYVQHAPKEVRPKLREIRAAIQETAPDVVESISYGMPFYSFRGESGFGARLCYFGFQKNCVVFYTRPAFLEEHGDATGPYLSSKSALHFRLDRPIPIQLIRKVVMTGLQKHGDGGDHPKAPSQRTRSKRLG